jgi:hypothetical protein
MWDCLKDYMMIGGCKRWVLRTVWRGFYPGVIC